MLKILLLGSVLAVFSLTTNAQEPCCQNQTAAQLMFEKGLSKIIRPNARKNIIIDRETITEKYDSNCNIESKKLGTPIEKICEPKSRKASHKATDLKLKVKGLDIDDLYGALAVRHSFYIDPAEDTKTIDGKTYVIVKFSPKDNLAIREATDQFVNRVSGSIYIDLDNLTITGIDGSINYSFYFNYSLLGFIPIRVDVYSFEFSVEYNQFENITVEKSVNGLVDYKIRNRNTEKYINKITNHRVK